MSHVEIPPKYFSATGSGIDIALFRRPKAVAALRKRIFSLEPTSKVRQRLLGRTFGVVWQTYERGDYTTVPNLFYAEDCEVHTAVEGRVDLPVLATGRAGVTRVNEAWHEPFRDVRWKPLELFDGGDVAYFAVEMTAVGAGSGAEVQSPFYAAVRIEDGLVSWQFMSIRRDEALREAGFAE